LRSIFLGEGRALDPDTSYGVGRRKGRKNGGGGERHTTRREHQSTICRGRKGRRPSARMYPKGPTHREQSYRGSTA